MSKMPSHEERSGTCGRPIFHHQLGADFYEMLLTKEPVLHCLIVVYNHAMQDHPCFIMPCVGYSAMHHKPMIYCQTSVMYSGGCIEVTTMANSVLWCQNSMWGVWTHDTMKSHI